MTLYDGLGPRWAEFIKIWQIQPWFAGTQTIDSRGVLTSRLRWMWWCKWSLIIQREKLKILKDNLDSDNVQIPEVQLYLAFMWANLNQFGYEYIDAMCEIGVPHTLMRFAGCGDVDIEVSCLTYRLSCYGFYRVWCRLRMSMWLSWWWNLKIGWWNFLKSALRKMTLDMVSTRAGCTAICQLIKTISRRCETALYWHTSTLRWRTQSKIWRGYASSHGWFPIYSTRRTYLSRWPPSHWTKLSSF